MNLLKVECRPPSDKENSKSGELNSDFGRKKMHGGKKGVGLIHRAVNTEEGVNPQSRKMDRDKMGDRNQIQPILLQAGVL